MTDAEIGETIAGYVLEAQLGEGSTSRVFVGRHQDDARRAALKVLTFSVMESRDARERLLREARAVNDIEHPNIAEVFGLHESETPPRVALIMELVEGPSLRTLRGEPLAPPSARRFALQLLSAVRAAHAAGVIHRDLKPDNILFTDEPRGEGAALKVVDFGLAKRLGPGDLLHTAAGTMLGTPAYMAPEQISGRPRPSPATDVYAVAELVYELFVGERAFSSDSSQVVLKQKMKGEVPELPMPAPLDKDLRPVLRECLLHDPTRRLGLSEIERALSGLGTTAMSIPAGQTALEARPSGQKPSSSVRVAAANTVVAAVTGPGELFSTRPSEPADSPPVRVRDRQQDVETGALDPDAVSEAQASPWLTEVDEGAVTDVVRPPDEVFSPDRTPTPPLEDRAHLASVPVVISRSGGHDPDADSVLLPLDVRAARGPGASRRVTLPVEDPADGEADTVPPEALETPGGPSDSRGLIVAAVVVGVVALVGFVILFN